MKYHFKLSLLISLCIIYAQANFGYKELAKVALQNEDLSTQEVVIDPKAKPEEKAQRLLQEISPLKKKQIIYNIFDELDKKPFTSIMPAHALYEINVILGEQENKQDSLLNNLSCDL